MHTLHLLKFQPFKSSLASLSPSVSLQSPPLLVAIALFSSSSKKSKWFWSYKEGPCLLHHKLIYLLIPSLWRHPICEGTQWRVKYCDKKYVGKSVLQCLRSWHQEVRIHLFTPKLHLHALDQRLHWMWWLWCRNLFQKTRALTVPGAAGRASPRGCGRSSPLSSWRGWRPSSRGSSTWSAPKDSTWLMPSNLLKPRW